MFHYFNALQLKTGLAGYFCRLIDADGGVVTMAADTSGTPIATVSGVANMAVADAAGNFSFYVEPGTYHQDIYGTDATTFIVRIASVPMGSAISGSISFQQSGTSAASRTLEAKGRDTLNAADFLPTGYVTDGSVDYTTQLQAAINEAVSRGKSEVQIPFGTFQVTGTGLSVSAGVKLRGVSRGGTVIKNLSGNVLRLAGEGIDLTDMAVWSVAGGHTIVQTATIAQCQFRRLQVVQSANGYSLFSNAGFEYINNRLEHFECQHATGATVPGWALTGLAGTINGNVFANGRWTNSGAYAFSIDGITTSDPQYDNIFEGIQFEVCTGGLINLKGCDNFVINSCWSDDAPLALKHGYLIEVGTGGSSCKGRISNCARRGSTNNTGIYDVKLPGSGGGAGNVIENCWTFGGAYGSFAIDLNSNSALVVGSSQRMSVANTVGLQWLDTYTGTIDAFGGFKVAGTAVVGARGAAVANATDAASAITQLNALLARCRAHGLIA